MKPANERREVGRVHCEMSVVLKLLHVPECPFPPPKRLVGHTSDISQEGTRITVVTEGNLPVGTKAKLKVKLPDSYRTIVLVGEARWVKHEPGVVGMVIGFDVAGSPKRKLHSWQQLIEQSD